MLKKIGVVLNAVLVMVLMTVNTYAAQYSVSEDQFVDSRFPGSTSPYNYPYGRYLWSGHQESRNTHAYTLLSFEIGERWNWEVAELNVPFNHFSGSEGETSIWFNPNDGWLDQKVSYNNLANLWDWSEPILLARQSVTEDAETASFDISGLLDLETNETVSLVIGSILPDETATGDYWRDIVNSDYPYGTATVTLTSDTMPVPEPATVVLFSIGLLGLVGSNRKRFKLSAVLKKK